MLIDKYGTVTQMVDAYVKKLDARDGRLAEEKRLIAKMSKEEAERLGLTPPKGKKMRKRKHLL